MRLAANILILAFIAAALAFHVQTVRADRYMAKAMRQCFPAPPPPRHGRRAHRPQQIEGCGVIHFAPDVIDQTPPEQNHCPVKTGL